MLRALRHRNFRLFLIGQTISLTGTWMENVAMSWLAYRLTGSPFVLGLFGSASQLPAFFLAPVGGVVADRANRHRMILITQALSMLQAFAVWGLVATHHVGVASLLALTALRGCINGIDVPVRQAFLMEMIGVKEDLPNAIALNSSVFNLARLIGPAAAGLLIAAAGEAGAFFTNAVSYVAVIAALLAMKVEPARAHASARPAVWPQLREGFTYAVGFAPIRALLLLVGLVSWMGVPVLVLMPVFAVNVFGGGPHTLGILMASVGVGALGAALFLASRRSVLGLGRVITTAVLVLGAALVSFSFVRHLGAAVPLVFAAGFGIMALMASSNTILQTIVDDDKRGRVMSLHAMSFMGSLPFGSLLAGALASRLGAPATVRMGGAMCLLAGLLFARALPGLRAAVRPVYRRLGILPEVPAVIEERV